MKSLKKKLNIIILFFLLVLILFMSFLNLIVIIIIIYSNKIFKFINKNKFFNRIVSKYADEWFIAIVIIEL